jgi:hypothetical protein
MKYWIQVVFFWIAIPMAFAQKVQVTLSVNPTNVEVGTPIVIQVSANVEGDFSIDFPSNFKKLAGTQRGMNQSFDSRSGKNITNHFFAQTGSFQAVGNYKFRAKIKTKKGIYQSNLVTVNVRKSNTSISDVSNSINTEKPVFGTVEIQHKTIYEGQSILVNSKIYTKYNLSVDAYEPVQFKGNPEIIDLQSSNELNFDPINIKGQTYYQTAFDKKILFYSESGKYEVGPFKMNLVYETPNDFIDYQIVSTKEIVEVIPLPSNAPKSFNGGIGNFKITRKFDQQEVKQGDVVVMTIEFEGEGNLKDMSQPIFDLPENVLIYGDPEVSENIQYAHEKVLGKKTYQFHLQFLEKGKFVMPAMNFSYFDPLAKKYVTQTTKDFEVNVEKSNQFENQVFSDFDDLNGESGLPQRNPAENQDKSNKAFVILSIALSIGLVTFLFLFWKRKSKEKIETFSEVLEERKEIQELDKLFAKARNSELNGDLKSSYLSLEKAIRLMVILVTEDLEELSNRQNVFHQLSDLVASCESARYMELYDKAKYLEILEQTKSIYITIKSQINT